MRPRGHCRYSPIALHQVVGDSQTLALVGSDGTIDWHGWNR